MFKCRAFTFGKMISIFKAFTQGNTLDLIFSQPAKKAC